MAANLETVFKQLTESSIIAQGKLEKFVPPKANPTSVDEFVAELVKQQHLTLFQAQQVKLGKAKALIVGEYTIVDRVGAGGMGQVFKGVHRRMDRTVAIKMLPPAMTKDAAAVARFEREVRAAAKLSHPNIVAAHDAGQAGAAHFLVMEYVEGQDLSVQVKKNGPFPVAKALNYMLQAARGLEFAHSEGVVHRDIKPANLLLDKKGTVKILDMGLARIESAVGAPAQAELTGTGTIMGTVDYMAPEQGMSTKHADARADIYSLGCSLYYLIVGKAAYDGETVAAKLVAHHTHPIPSLQEAHPEISDRLEAVFKKMVAKKIEDRYQTMTEVLAELERCQAALNASASSSTSAWQATATDQESELSIAFSHVREHLIPRVDMEEFKPKTKPVRTAKPKPPSTRAQAERGSGRRRSVLIGLVAAGLLGASILAAVIVIQLRTQDGTLIVEVNQPDAIVQVLDQEGKVEISQPGGLKPVSISVVPGKHRIRVEKDGFVTIADDIEIASGTKLDIKARLVPAKQLAATSKTLLPPREDGRRPDEGVRPWNTPAFRKWMTDTQKLPAEKQIEAVSKKLMELNPGFDGKVTGRYNNSKPMIIKGVVTEFGFPADNVTDISPVRALVGLTVLACVGSVPGSGKLSELSPLEGMPLTTLYVSNTPVSTLSPLAGMSLTYLYCNDSEVSDLSPLTAMPLTQLHCRSTRVSDLSSLFSVPALARLDLRDTQVSAASVAALQKALSKCKIEWDAPAKLAYLDPAFQAWVKATQALPAEKQIEAVSKKLMELNPGFDGVVTDYRQKGPPKVENGAVTEFSFVADNVTDLSPVQALAGLKILVCGGSGSGSKLSDLSPLQGMNIAILACSNTRVSDLSPLRGMKLAHLYCSGTPLSDLSPLRAAPLTILHCRATQVSDLSPLEHCKSLTSLNVAKTEVTPATVAALQKALPKCKIEWDAPKKLAYLDPAFQAWVKATQALPAEKQIEAVSKKLMELNPGFDGKVTGSDVKAPPKIENGVVTRLGFFTHDVTDISPLQALHGLRELACHRDMGKAYKGKLSDLSPLQGMRLTYLYCVGTPVSDLSPLVGMPLAELHCSYTLVSDLAPLRGMPLRVLDCSASQVLDLAPLEGMPLTLLHCHSTNVSDLSPLRGMPLSRLGFGKTQVTDLSPLQGMKLTEILFWPQDMTKGIEVLRQMTTLKKIGLSSSPKEQFSPAEFWKKYDAGEFGKPAAPAKLAYLDPAFQAWVKATQALPAEQQIEAVSKKLMELNPGFDGKLMDYEVKGTPKIAGGVVLGLGFFTDNVTDISPVRALAGLKYLGTSGSGRGTGMLSDLSPLAGMKLELLVCYGSKVFDLSPLAGMRLTKLGIGNASVSDLSPLQGMPLVNLACPITKVADLSPLRGMPLSMLDCSNSQVADLSPLKGMPLSSLRCGATPVSDLSPLIDCKRLVTLFVVNTKVSPASVAALQKALPKCKIEWDGPAKTATDWNTPAFQAWVKATQALPAEQQIEAVSKKLMELNPGFDGKLTAARWGGHHRPPKIEQGVVAELGCAGAAVADLSPLRALTGLKAFGCWSTEQVRSALADLSPLAGLQLDDLYCAHSRVADLSPLRAMRLAVLLCYDTSIADLTPVKGMPLTTLGCSETPVSDLSPLAGMSVQEFSFTPQNITQGLDAIRQMKSLKHITPGLGKEVSAAEFWKKYDAGEFGKPAPSPQPSPARGEGAKKKLAYLDPAFQAWVKATQALPAEKQIEAVSKKLMELNPGFDGKLTSGDRKGPPKTDQGMVTELGFITDSVTDLSPVRALVGLKVLICPGTNNKKQSLSDLSPLRGMSLRDLNCSLTKVSDLSPLQGMNLTNFACNFAPVADLSPLRGLRLLSLYCGGTELSDLSPLEGMPLKTLDCERTTVADISVLRAMPLTTLLCGRTRISDLSPLLECKSLASLRVTGAKATAAGVAALQKALPNCKIDSDDPAKATRPAPASCETR